ncbi:hypothetical protein ACPBEH_04595 [Latilactobacillus sp. 5-91]|uniref:hypothetical protein n=1 Tax=Latilactobacillus TaxID=2767885 RepID=UPI000B9692EA|nr:hypothetical protein [Latilactobacillus sakei]AST83072.1 hypothetical protein LBS_00550 [Latilactobacillus sakei]AWZ43801.1 hypothetical protein CXB68_01705 [Latilactobacillus sakei]QGL60970.1 hypothetical protein GJ664_06570 [Latilactobacillus sakei]QVQ49480.1 hypothetical protein KIK01_03115 [Latilactobacillus sakei subsp. sakei]USF95806.1 hypothetical protein A4W82_02830 [Latilactobacillus sakei]
MPFLLILVPILAIILAITVMGVLIGSVMILFKFAIPLLVIWLIYRLIVGHNKPRHHYHEQQHQAYYSQPSDSRGRKEARDVKVDDDNWSDF